MKLTTDFPVDVLNRVVGAIFIGTALEESDISFLHPRVCVLLMKAGWDIAHHDLLSGLHNCSGLLAIVLENFTVLAHQIVEIIHVHLLTSMHGYLNVHGPSAVTIDLRIAMLGGRRWSLTGQASEAARVGGIVEEVWEHVGVGVAVVRHFGDSSAKRAQRSWLLRFGELPLVSSGFKDAWASDARAIGFWPRSA